MVLTRDGAYCFLFEACTSACARAIALRSPTDRMDCSVDTRVGRVRAMADQASSGANTAQKHTKTRNKIKSVSSC